MERDGDFSIFNEKKVMDSLRFCAIRLILKISRARSIQETESLTRILRLITCFAPLSYLNLIARVKWLLLASSIGVGYLTRKDLEN